MTKSFQHHLQGTYGYRVAQVSQQVRYYVRHEAALVSLLHILEPEHYIQATQLLATASVDHIDATTRAVSIGVSWNDIVQHGTGWAELMYSITHAGNAFK